MLTGTITIITIFLKDIYITNLKSRSINSANEWIS